MHPAVGNASLQNSVFKGHHISFSTVFTFFMLSQFKKIGRFLQYSGIIRNFVPFEQGITGILGHGCKSCLFQPSYQT